MFDSSTENSTYFLSLIQACNKYSKNVPWESANQQRAIYLDTLFPSTELCIINLGFDILSICALEFISIKLSFDMLSVQFSSVAQLCPTFCDPMNRSTPGLPVHHRLPEFTQTHVHRVRDAIQPSHSLSSPSPPAPNPSQHQSLFQ